MKKKIILAMVTGVVLVMAAGCGTEESDSAKNDSKKKTEQKSGVSSKREEIVTMPITFVNNTDMDIYRLYASSTETDDWEEDILGDTLLEPGDYIEVDFSYSEEETIWDFAIEDEEENLLEYYDMDFEDYGEEGITICLNEDETAEILEGADAYQTLLEQSENAWKDRYIEFINSNQSRGTNAKYALVYIDWDEIPELYIDYGNNAAGGQICSFHYIEGKERFEVVDVGVEGSGYIQKQGLVCDCGGSMGYYYDNIYYMEDGGFLQIFQGEYKEDDGSGIRLDEYGEIIYTYYMDGTRVTEEEYMSTLNSKYDAEDVSLFYDEEVSREQILSTLNNW